MTKRRDPYLDEIIVGLDWYFERANANYDEAFALLSPEESRFVDEEIDKCQDPRYYLENYHVVNTEGEGLKTLYPFWEAQEIFYEVIMDIHGKGVPVKLIVLKARQEGISTLVQGMIFHATIFNEARFSLTIAQDGDISGHLFEMSRRAYDALPWWMRPEERYNAKGKYLHFDRKDPVLRQVRPGLRSQINVEAANKMTAIAGITIHNGHFSELSDWPNAEILTTGLFPAMNAPDGIYILESTARGRNNFWHRLWKSAIEGKTPQWKTVFIEWFRVKKYATPLDDGAPFVRTKDEIELCQKVKEDTSVELSDEQLNWRRGKIEETIALEGDEWKFYQEYPSNWREAFQSTGLCAFNKRALQKIMETTCHFPLWVGEIDLDGANLKRPKLKGRRVKDPNEQLLPQENYGERLHMWEGPDTKDPNARYIVAADVGQGIVGGDYSVAHVLKIGRGQQPDVQVAEWHGWIDATPFARVLAALGYLYKGAMISCEINGIGGTTNNALFRELAYENLFIWKHYDKIKEFVTAYFGWSTNAKTRPALITKFREALTDKNLILRSYALLEQCMDFGRAEHGPMRIEGQDGNDDRVFAAMIARFCAHDTDWDPGSGFVTTVIEEDQKDPNADRYNTDYSPMHDNPAAYMRRRMDREGVDEGRLKEEALHQQIDAGNDDGDWRNL